MVNVVTRVCSDHDNCIDDLKALTLAGVMIFTILSDILGQLQLS